MSETIPYGRQDINAADIEAVVNVLRSDFLTQGPAVPAFEQAVAGYCGAKHAVAVNSATSALHLACLALGVGKGDIVWTSPITFVASANCALYCGATVDFVDIDPHSYNISAAALEEKLIVAEQRGRLPKVVIPVHFAGQSCDMENINALAERYGFKIIEDASHAIGGKYRGKPVGNCSYSDITVFSFHPVKIITTGEGGMALSNDIHLAKRMQLLRSHGITRDAAEMTHEPDGSWYYQQIMLGYNYRITDIQAALGLSQLVRLDDFIQRRHVLASRYNDALSSLPIIVPRQHPDAYSAFHLYPVLIPNITETKQRLAVFEGVRKANIGVNVHYIPVHLQPYYRLMGFNLGDFPVAEKYYQEAISLPIYATLSEENQHRVVSVLQDLLQ